MNESQSAKIKNRKNEKEYGKVADFFPWQEEALRLYFRFSPDGTKYFTINAGRRAGKSKLACEIIKMKAMTLPDAKIVFCALSIGNAKRIMWEELVNACGIKNVKENKSTNEIHIANKFGGWSTVYFFGWDNIDRARGLAVDLFVFDEVAMYRNFYPGINGAVIPATMDKGGRIIFISSPNGLNHFYDIYSKSGEDYTSFHATIYDNPKISREELEKEKARYDKLYFEREFLAKFVKMEGLIYHTFDRHKHCVKPEDVPQNFIKKIVGVDFGYSDKAASTIIEIGIDANNHLWVYKENYFFRKQNDYLINYINTVQPQEVYPDTAEQDRIDQMEEAGLNVMRVSKARKPGFDRVNQLFAQGRIHISTECTQLIAELENYSWKEDGDEPDKASGFNADGVDALRYAVFNSVISFMSTEANKGTRKPVSYKYKTIF